MKNSVVLLTLLAAACSNVGQTPEQKRITQLEAENAQLQAQLKESRENVTKLHTALGRGGFAEETTAEEPGGAVAPQPFNPQPATNVGGGGGESSSSGQYVE